MSADFKLTAAIVLLLTWAIAWFTRLDFGGLIHALPFFALVLLIMGAGDRAFALQRLSKPYYRAVRLVAYAILTLTVLGLAAYIWQVVAMISSGTYL